MDMDMIVHDFPFSFRAELTQLILHPALWFSPVLGQLTK